MSIRKNTIKRFENIGFIYFKGEAGHILLNIDYIISIDDKVLENKGVRIHTNEAADMLLSSDIDFEEATSKYQRVADSLVNLNSSNRNLVTLNYSIDYGDTVYKVAIPYRSIAHIEMITESSKTLTTSEGGWYPVCDSIDQILSSLEFANEKHSIEGIINKI